VFGDLLLSNEGPTVDCVTLRMCLPKRSLAMAHSVFQAVFTEPLPSNGHIRHNIIFPFPLLPNASLQILKFICLQRLF
jgi:hypothetical protein